MSKGFKEHFVPIITPYLEKGNFILLGVMENVLSLYPGQSWDTSILPVLSSYGEPFMDAVCRDSCDGHDVGRVSCCTLQYFFSGDCMRQGSIKPDQHG